MKLQAELEVQLQKSLQKAQLESFEIFSIEQLVLCLLETNSVNKILLKLKVDTKKMQEDLKAYIYKNVPKVKSKDPQLSPIMSVGAQRMLQRSWHHAVSSEKANLMPEDLLVSLYQEDESYSLHLLKDQYAVSRISLLNEISHGVGRPAHPENSADQEEGAFSGALESYCEDLLSEKYGSGIDNYMARDYHLKRLVQILSRKSRNNPLVVGENGVGKTCLARNLAKKITSGDVPSHLKKLNFYELKVSKLMAGAKFRGELEERLGLVYNELKQKGNSIFLIDDIASILNTGNTQGGGIDTAHLLRPFLEDNHIHLLATCTHKDYKTIFDKNSGLSRFFQNLKIEEASLEETKVIIESRIKSYEDFHKMKYPIKLIDKSIELGKRYLSAKKLPDSAFDLIDETCATAKLKKPKPIQIELEHITEVISQMSGIPNENLKSNQGENLKNLESLLMGKIYGQDKAVKQLVSAVKYSFAGLSRENKPIGSYMFAGSTGVGKTELAIQISKALGNHFVKFDMSEYLEKHSVARLVGAPPGYVGYEEGGLLTEAISAHPYSVLLMDEIEKAHPDLINILLQIMDAGQITDSNGKNVDCRNVILIMTTNAGSMDISKNPIGISTNRLISFDMQILKRYFSPEFLNRIDSIVEFSPLNKEILFKVTQKFMEELKEQLSKKSVLVEYDDNLIHYLVDVSFDPALGARPIHRKISDLIKAPLADELLFGQLSRGGKVKISYNSKDLGFEYSGIS